MWEWRNEAETRQSSFDSRYIPYEEHESWFAGKIETPDTQIFVILNGGGEEVGYVRYELKGEQAEISVSVNHSHRGKGYGPFAIGLGSERLLANGPAKCVVAHVKLDNAASLAAFRRAGFAKIGVVTIAGAEACRMIYKKECLGTRATP